jgi:hypothetical protein
LFKYTSNGELGKSELHQITSKTSVFSIQSFRGEFIVIFFVETDVLDHTIIVFSHFIESSVISDAITVKVQDFFIISHLEKVFTH